MKGVHGRYGEGDVGRWGARVQQDDDIRVVDRFGGEGRQERRTRGSAGRRGEAL